MKQKQKLLDKEAFQKKLKQTNQRSAIERQQALIKQKKAELQTDIEVDAPSNSTSSAKKSNLRYAFIALLLIILVIFPYPKVIVYEKLGVVAQSIYIPSRFGSPEFFLDTHYQVDLENDHRWLYLCDRQTKRHCNRYDIVEIKGVFSAMKLYLTGNS